MRAVLRTIAFIAVASATAPLAFAADSQPPASEQTQAQPPQQDAKPATTQDAKKDAPQPAKDAAKAKPAPAKESAKAAAEAKAPTEVKTPVVVPPERKAAPPDVAGECAWIGKRIVSLLARDDVEQSKRFLEFYRLFDCREKHLAQSFRCVISETATPEEDINLRIDRCWVQDF